MDEQPLISIVVPVYRVEELLPRCIESLLMQTYRNIEIVLIDDGSPDRCGEICDQYAQKDPRIRVIHQQNRGVAGARNAGLDAATGEYIGFVDSDDWVEPRHCEALYQSLIENQAQISICGHRIYHGPDWVEIRSFPEIRGIIPKEKALEYLLRITMFEGYLWNKLFTRAILEHAKDGDPLRFDPQVHIAEDLLFVCQYMIHIEAIAYTPDVLYNYVEREGSALKSYGEERRSELIASQKIIDMFRTYNRVLYDMAKARYVEASVNLMRYAVRGSRREKLPELREEVKRYLDDYLKDSAVKLRAKFRVLVILRFPVLSDRIWLFLKKTFRLIWEPSRLRSCISIIC